MSKTATISIIILILSTIGFAWAYWGGSSVTAPVSSGLTSSSGGKEGEEFLRALNILRKITFDQTVLDDNLFKRLTDFTRPLIKEEKGKFNPFAPLESSQMVAKTAGADITQTVKVNFAQAPKTVSTGPKVGDSVISVIKGFREAVAKGDIQLALKYLMPDFRTTTQKLLEDIGEKGRVELAASLNNPVKVKEDDGIVKYEVTYTRDGETFTWPIFMGKENGIWKIDRM